MDLYEAIQAHTDWRSALHRAIDNRRPVDDPGFISEAACKLHLWLHGEAHEMFAGLETHSDCLRKNAAFHKVAGEVVAAINAGHYADALAMLNIGGVYQKASVELLLAMATLKREVVWCSARCRACKQRLATAAPG